MVDLTAVTADTALAVVVSLMYGLAALEAGKIDLAADRYFVVVA